MPGNLYQNVLLPMRQYSALKIVQTFQEKMHLLREVCLCEYCDHAMCLRQARKNIDGYAWQCRNSGCMKHKTTISIRTGSFFENYRLPLIDILLIMYHWCGKESVTGTERYMGCTRKTISSIHDRCRFAINNFLRDNPVRLGGPGAVCQIGESAFSCKSDAHRDGASQNIAWVFGIVDTRFAPVRGYMEIVPNRSKETLLPIIERVCRSGTIVQSNESEAYKIIRESLDNHLIRFVNHIDGEHTQHIKSYLSKHKLPIKSMKGIQEERLPMYLQECVWRDMVGDDAFLEFLKLNRT